MANKLQQGSVIPEFRYDTPYRPQQSFYSLLEGDKPVMLIFLRNFGHPLSRHYIMRYIQTIDRLYDARLVCVVQTKPSVIAEALPERELPYRLICDAEGVLYDFFGVESERSWLKSYSFKALKILREAKKQGYEENRSEPQQLPLTAVVGPKGYVYFAHYGQSITDLPEDCEAMQRVMEGLLASLPKEEEEQAPSDWDLEQVEVKKNRRARRSASLSKEEEQAFAMAAASGIGPMEVTLELEQDPTENTPDQAEDSYSLYDQALKQAAEKAQREQNP